MLDTVRPFYVFMVPTFDFCHNELKHAFYLHITPQDGRNVFNTGIEQTHRESIRDSLTGLPAIFKNSAKRCLMTECK